ncbi:MAG: ABC transporter permease [Chloroflexi bacterium]|nr:ABC transporter permease [Chloroflexota bacterium]
MRAYVIRRVMATFPVLLFVATAVFLILRLTPGDPVQLMIGNIEESDWVMIKNIEEVRRRLGLDQPIHVQYGKFLWRTIQGDLGTSIFSGQSVTSIFRQRFEPTVTIGILSKILALGIAIPLGILAAWKANTWVDRGIMVYVVLGFSIPAFWLAYNMIFLFAVYLGWFPAVGYKAISDGVGLWMIHLVLPVAVLGLTGAALTTRITRSTMLEVLREDYIRTARSKGLAERVVLVRHALKNASIPILTIIALGLATIVSGLVIIETVFAIPGMGRALVEAILKRDYPVIQGLIMITAFVFVLLNLATDLLYAYLDPRIRY